MATNEPAPAPPPPGLLEDLKQTLVKTARSLLNLKIVTVVGDAQVTVAADDRAAVAIDPGKVVTSMTTNINLIEGDIWTAIGDGMITGNYTDMRAYHGTMVDRAQSIVSENVEVVKTIIEKIAEMNRDPRWTDARPPS